MAMDKNVLTRALKEIPALTDKDIPALWTRAVHVETQLFEFKKVLYRLSIDVQVAKHYASKEDTDAVSTASSKLAELASQIKGCKWTLEALRNVRADVEVEIQKLKDPAKFKKELKAHMAANSAA